LKGRRVRRRVGLDRENNSSHATILRRSRRASQPHSQPFYGQTPDFMGRAA
jgi:hypothetical protein